MRTLGIETSGLRGSVALAENGRAVCAFHHSSVNRHAEETLGLVERALAEAGWSKSSLDRLGAGTGPGSFTGVRVGLALATGLSVGLDRPVVGVGSLLALAATDAFGDSFVPLAEREDAVRVVVRDARRDEFFVAVFDRGFATLVPPRAIARTTALEELRAFTGAWAPARLRLVGASVPGFEVPRNDQLDPDARAVALLAADFDPALHPLEPNYVRDAGAVKPNLPPSPLASR